MLKDYNNKYRKKSVTTHSFHLFPRDTDIKARMDERKEAGEGASAYLRRLVREDIAKEAIKKDDAD